MWWCCFCIDLLSAQNLSKGKMQISVPRNRKRYRNHYHALIGGSSSCGYFIETLIHIKATRMAFHWRHMGVVATKIDHSFTSLFWLTTKGISKLHITGPFWRQCDDGFPSLGVSNVERVSISTKQSIFTSCSLLAYSKFVLFVRPPSFCHLCKQKCGNFIRISNR